MIRGILILLLAIVAVATLTCGETRQSAPVQVTFTVREPWPLAPGRYGALCVQCVEQLDKVTVCTKAQLLICRVEPIGPLPGDVTTTCKCEESVPL